MVKGEVLIINIPSSTTSGTHPPGSWLQTKSLYLFGCIALLTLVKVAIRVTDSLWKLDVLLSYMLGI